MDYDKAFNLPQSYYNEIKREKEMVNRNKIPKDSACPSCKSTKKLSDYCDNSCSTLTCLNCNIEYYYDNGIVHVGHSETCDDDDDYDVIS